MRFDAEYLIALTDNVRIKFDCNTSSFSSNNHVVFTSSPQFLAANLRYLIAILVLAIYFSHQQELEVHATTQHHPPIVKNIDSWKLYPHIHINMRHEQIYSSVFLLPITQINTDKESKQFRQTSYLYFSLWSNLSCQK